jgi:plasmid replication initiation protein
LQKSIKKQNNELNPFELNLQEQNIILALINVIEPTDDPFQMYRFSEKELAQMLDLQENIQANLYNILKGLLRKRVEISTANSTLDVNWLISLELLEQEGNRYIELEISNKLKPYLLELKKKTIDEV